MRPRALTTALLALILAACAVGADPPVHPAPRVHLTGSGSTFVEPFLTRAFYEYSIAHPGTTVEYHAVGSGAGIAALTAREVDFAASDVPMNAAEIDRIGGPDRAIQFPEIVGAVAVPFNLPGLDHLRLDGPTLAGIYLGELGSWNVQAIAALNPGLRLPAQPITVIHRSDSSGTSSIFTDFLSRVSPTWAAKVGQAKLPAWPAGTGVPGSEGVAKALESTSGSIGYVDLAYLRGTSLHAAEIQNRAGFFLAPSVSGASAAAEQVGSPSPSAPSIVDQPGATSYPISGFSWLVLRRDVAAATAAAEVAIFRWLVTRGQDFAAARDYSPLPRGAQATALAALAKFTAP